MAAVEANNMIKKDCIFYREKKTISEDSAHQVREVTKGKGCSALKDLYCRYGQCRFYKSNKEYDKDGRRKQEEKTADSLTVDEIRDKIRSHCKARSEVYEHCDGCPAFDLPINGCYENTVPDSTVKRVYKLLVKTGEL